jgi:hypothetical protein
VNNDFTHQRVPQVDESVADMRTDSEETDDEDADSTTDATGSVVAADGIE